MEQSFVEKQRTVAISPQSDLNRLTHPKKMKSAESKVFATVPFRLIKFVFAEFGSSNKSGI